MDFFGGDVVWKRGNVDGGILAFTGFGGWFGLFGRSSASCLLEE